MICFFIKKFCDLRADLCPRLRLQLSLEFCLVRGHGGGGEAGNSWSGELRVQ